MKVEIAIAKEKKTQCEIKKMPVSELKLDPKNTRFRHLGTKSDPEMEDYLWKDPDTKKLYNAMLAAGGATEPLVIDSNNVVREGNRRLVCLRKLSENVKKGDKKLKGFSKTHFDEVQCYVLPPDTTEKDMAMYLANIHVIGKDPWPALNKAAHLYDLYDTHGMTIDDIKDYLAMGKQTVINQINAFDATLRYRDNYGEEDPDWLKKYSYFAEIYKNPFLREWIKDNRNEERVQKWIAEGRIELGRYIRRLPEIIRDEKALEKLETENIRAAIKAIEEKDPSLTSPTFKIIKQATVTLRENFPRSEFILSSKDNARIKMLKELHSAVEDILEDIEKIKPKEAA